jgi:hypothetical protein
MKKTLLWFCCCIILWNCSNHKILTNQMLKNNSIQPDQLVGLAASISEELVLIPVIQNISPLSKQDSSKTKHPLFLPKETFGKISFASNDTIKVMFEKKIELAFCRNPKHMQKNLVDDAFYLSMVQVRHMDGTKSFVIKSGQKLYLPSIHCWNCKLLLKSSELYNPKN